MRFYPHSIAFPQVNLNDYLRQAVGAIIQLFTALPSTTIPSLQVGDLVPNALLDIAKQLQRAQPIPNTQGTPALLTDALPPRVDINVPSHRVQAMNVAVFHPLKLDNTQQSPTIAKLQQHSTKPKAKDLYRKRFKSTTSGPLNQKRQHHPSND